VHKTANVLNKLPKSQQPKAQRALQEIWMAETKKDALAAFDAFIETWGVKYDKAGECLVKDRDALLAFYDFSAEYWKHLRTTKRHRKFVRHGAPPHRALQRMSLKPDRARHDLQARRGCRKTLASPQWPQPVAENILGRKFSDGIEVVRIASSNRCRLIPSVAKIRRYLGSLECTTIDCFRILFYQQDREPLGSRRAAARRSYRSSLRNSGRTRRKASADRSGSSDGIVAEASMGLGTMNLSPVERIEEPGSFGGR
jgi:Transposase, Mutator family